MDTDSNDGPDAKTQRRIKSQGLTKEEIRETVMLLSEREREN